VSADGLDDLAVGLVRRRCRRFRRWKSARDRVRSRTRT
jgi:hypothetical protein